MKPEVTLKYLSYLRNKRNNGQQEGFTLIELLVVVIIIGVLAAVALPNLLSQVGKARESELKNAVGTVNRTQQSYHFEKQSFAPDVTFLGIGIPVEYIDGTTTASLGLTGGLSSATVAPINAEATSQDETRAYSGRIDFANGAYTQVMCQTNATATQAALPATASTCAAGTTKVR